MAPEIGTNAYKQLVSIDTAVEKLATEVTVGGGLKVNGAVTTSGTVAINCVAFTTLGVFAGGAAGVGAVSTSKS